MRVMESNDPRGVRVKWDLPLPPVVGRVVEALARAGGLPMVVGGAIRDALLGRARDGKDFDLEVYRLEVEVIERVLAEFATVHRVGRAFGVLHAVFPDGVELDVGLPRRESKTGAGHRGFLVVPDPEMTPREAAERRDFRCNAMLYDPLERELHDYFDGRGDIGRRLLRHVGPRFAEDPLRVLRGFQLAARLDFRLDRGTAVLCRTLRAEAGALAIERVWGEWYKWAARGDVPSRGLDVLEQTGWLELYPELVRLAGCPQEPAWHPEGDVMAHTRLVVDAAAGIARRDRLDPTDRAVLVLSALCHDLGKPETTRVDEDGRIRSPGHTEATATIESFLRRIGTPDRIARRVVALSRHHLAHLGFAGSKRHVRRLARSLEQAGGETIPMLARLVEADASGRPPLPGGLPDEMRRLLEVAREVDADAAAPRPLLRGRDLIAAGMKPGPRMGRVLEAAYEAQLDGAFADLEGALAWLEQSGWLDRERGDDHG